MMRMCALCSLRRRVAVAVTATILRPLLTTLRILRRVWLLEPGVSWPRLLM